ncbi:MAG: efflux RND transporter periplasmic adaptor subunit [Verrucomicrobia bacterium]|nr:efflux RND transporter periplasmic adaptor subunit [Verrucomicrobiota bacterium]
MQLHPLLILPLLIAPPLQAGEADQPPTEVAVQVAKITRTTLTRSVTAYGAIDFEPAGKDLAPAIARLSPAVAGLITEINGVEGQQVNQGEVLFKLDSRAADAAVVKATLSIKFATANFERQQQLAAAEGTSEKQVLEAGQALAQAEAELATAKVQQSLLRGVAPMNGTLLKFTARPGEAADATTVLAEIADLDRLVAALRVPRLEAAALQPGQPAKLHATGAATPVAGNITFISPQVDATSDTLLVRVRVPKGSGLRPGEFVTACIVVEEHADKLAVPRASVYTNGEGVSTISIVEGDLAQQRVVKAGLRDGEWIEIEGAGLREGATVVTVGSYALPEQTKVRIVEP